MCIYIVNAYIVENFIFDEYDEIQHMDDVQQQESDVLSKYTPSDYLRKQQNTRVYSNRQLLSEETKL